MPISDRLYNQYQTKRLNVVGIALDRERMEVVNSFVKKFGIDYPILFANDRALKDYDIMALPTAILIDRAGRIRHRFEGADYLKTTGLLFGSADSQYFLYFWRRKSQVCPICCCIHLPGEIPLSPVFLIPYHRLPVVFK